MSSLTADNQLNLTASVLAASHTESEEELPRSHTESELEEGLPSINVRSGENQKRAAKVSSTAPHRVVH